MLKKLILALTLTVTVTANAATVEELTERVADCEDTLDRADHVIDIQAKTIQEYSDQNYRLQQSLDYATAQIAEEQAWYNNPKYIAPVVFILGVTLGAFAARAK